MWFRTRDNTLINLDNVTRIYEEKLFQVNEYKLFAIVEYANGNQDYFTIEDRLDIERLLMKRNKLRYKEIKNEEHE